MDANTHPAAFAYAAARCEARKACDRYAPAPVRADWGVRVVQTGAALRKADRAAWQAVRAVLGIDHGVTDPGLVLARAADLLPAPRA